MLLRIKYSKVGQSPMSSMLVPMESSCFNNNGIKWVRFAVSFPVVYLRKTSLSLSSKRFNDCINKRQHFFFLLFSWQMYVQNYPVEVEKICL